MRYLTGRLVFAEVTSCHMKAGRFMQEQADFGATRTRSGYNPLLQDYTNFSMYLGGTLQQSHDAGQAQEK